ncbi:hypothetical protein COLO4_13036 [Corchorus olitorius]|uniref:Elongation factor EFG domain-containing protein n=1 Tax=Corchorus olitorius TaxID=93759 RepID=A0A1R3JYL8_9ROSI|nr:hypothetical protein COLO4_13036 [Corchorus olitorius]
MRGVCFEVLDAVLQADADTKEIIPTVRKVCYAFLLTASPRLLEPVHLIQIQAPKKFRGDIYSMLEQRRGECLSAEKSNPLSFKVYFLSLSLFGFLEHCGMQHQGRLTSDRAFLITAIWCQAIPCKLEPWLRIWSFKLEGERV